MSTSVAVVVAEVLEQQALSLPDRAQRVNITDQPSYTYASGLLIDFAALENQIKLHHGPIKEAAHKAHKAACDAEKRVLEPVTLGKNILKGKIAAWEEEQEKIRLEAQRRQEEEARKLSEQMALEAAVAAEEAGASAEELEVLLAEQPVLPVAQAAPTFVRTAGVSTRETWHAEVVDLVALCRAVADGTLSSQYVLPNMPALNKRASAEKHTLKIPGVVAKKDVGITVRSR